MTVQRAIDALNDVVMDSRLSYDETRKGLLLIQKHVAHLLTHYPSGQHLNHNTIRSTEEDFHDHY